MTTVTGPGATRGANLSTLADLIVDNGPYVAGQVMPFPQDPVFGHIIITAAQINELRDELIRLREQQGEAIVLAYNLAKATGELP